MSTLVNRGGNAFCSRGASHYMDRAMFLSGAPKGDSLSASAKRPRAAAFLDVYADEQQKKKRLGSIDDLPDECLFEILRRLPGNKERSISACVSKRWLMLLSSIHHTETPLCGENKVETAEMPEIDLDFDVDAEFDEIGVDGHLIRLLNEEEVTDVRLAAIAVGTAGRGGLGELGIYGSHPTRGVTDVGLSAIARGCPSLRILHLWAVPDITDAGLAEIASGCPMLQNIELVNCPKITDKGLVAVSRSCPKLASLTLEACSGIGNEGLPAIGQRCSELEFISIQDCAQVGDKGVVGLVISASASLKRIKLHNVNISDVSLAVIGQYGKSVGQLSLSGLQNVNERGFWVMGSTRCMQELKVLTIISCSGFTNLSLAAIAKGSPSLKQVCLHGCSSISDAGLGSLSQVAMVLENLQLEECNGITLLGVVGFLLNGKPKFKSLALVKCMGIKDIDSFSTPLVSCSSLRTLTIRDCPGFTSSNLAILEKICPRLQNIDIGGLVGVTDTGLLPLLKSPVSRLVNVKLNGCVNLTDYSIYALAKVHGDTLQVLDVNGCAKLTDRSVIAIGDSCSALVELDMSKCGITDYGVAVLACSKKLNLKVLSMAGCFNVTEQSLPFLSNFGKSLYGMNLQNCKMISRRAIRLVKEKLWWCDVLF